MKKVLLIFATCFATFSSLEAAEDSGSEEPFPDAPCKLRSLAAYKDSQMNLWGVGEGNLWWYNSTNFFWSLLPFPNGTLASDNWKVTCADAKSYVALQAQSGTLVLHLPWQHWQPVDVDEVYTGSVIPEGSWCKNGVLYTTDSAKSNIYRLDNEEARWVLHSEISVINRTNQTASKSPEDKVGRAWILANGELVLVDQDYVLLANSSGMDWSILKKREDKDPWPNLLPEAISWSQDSNLWWWSTEFKPKMWDFNSTESAWQDVSYINRASGSDIKEIFTTWVDQDKFCFIIRMEKCVSQYSKSATMCASGVAGKAVTQSVSLLRVTPTASMLTSSEAKNNTSTSRVIVPPPTSDTIISSTQKAVFISAHTIINKHALLAALKNEPDDADEDINMPITAAVPIRHSNWHQHTSVFGSAIFFGTSLALFGVVGTIWCTRRCVYFPKEALLLRDPPSVRYTAIPDNLPYDARSQPTATYTVIPDSIA